MYPPRSVVCVTVRTTSISSALTSFCFFQFFTRLSWVWPMTTDRQGKLNRLGLYNTTGKLEGSINTLFFLENKNLPSLTWGGHNKKRTREREVD